MTINYFYPPKYIQKPVTETNHIQQNLTLQTTAMRDHLS